MTNSNGDIPAGGSTTARLLEVAQDGVDLLRQEVNLARQETIEKLTPAALSSGMVLAGGMLVATGSSYVADAIVRALATRMPHWLASLVFGGGLTAGGLALIRRGSNEIKNIDLLPTKTLHSLKEDKAWLLQQIKSRLI